MSRHTSNGPTDVSNATASAGSASHGSDLDGGGTDSGEDGSGLAGDEPTRLDAETVFEGLSNQRRLYVYHYLSRIDGRSADVSELTDRIAGWENDKPADRVSGAERNRVATALRQFHLPKLADLGFIDYDRQRGRARLRDAAADLSVSLHAPAEPVVPWPRVYLGLAGLHAVVLAAAVVEVGPFPLASPAAAAALAVVTLGGTAAVHLRSWGRGDDGGLPGVDVDDGE